MSDPIADGRSFLFVPGDRPDRFNSAMMSGADAVIFDLEDAVAPASKDIARTALAQRLDALPGAVLRINAWDTAWFAADLDLCRHPHVSAIMLPKALSGEGLTRVADVKPVIALIESAQGILDMVAVAATPGVVRLTFGAIDLALDLGTCAPDAAFNPFRLQMVVASRAANIAAPIDAVTRDYRDPGVVREDTRNALSLGFTGKLCIHPAQIDPVHEGFRPTDTELERAQAIIAADLGSAGAAVSIGGQMVDRPVVENARRVLIRASERRQPCG